MRATSYLLIGWLILSLHSKAAGPPVRNPNALPAGAIARFGDPTARSGGVYATLRLSPDNRLFLLAPEAFDLRTGREVALPLPDDSKDEDIEGFAPDGSVILAGKSAIRFVTQKGAVRSSVPSPKNEKPRAILLSEDGHTMACMQYITGDDEISIIHRKRGTTPAHVFTAAGRLELIALSPDGSTVAAKFGSTTGLFWDARTGKKLNQIELLKLNDPNEIRATAFTPNGHFFAVQIDPGEFRVVATREGVDAPSPPKCDRPFCHLQYSADGHILMGLTDRGDILRWDTRAGKDAKWEVHAKTPLSGLTLQRAVLSRDQTTLVAKIEHGPLQAWNLTTKKLLLDVPYNPYISRFKSRAPNTMHMLRGDRVVEWDVRTGKLLRDWPTPDERQITARLHPEQELFAEYEKKQRRVIVSNLATGKEVYQAHKIYHEKKEPLITTSGRNLVAVSHAGLVDVFHIARPKPLIRLWELHYSNVVAFSPDGRFLIYATSSTRSDRNSTGWDLYYRKVVVVELASRQVRKEIPINLRWGEGEIQSLYFEPTSRYVIVVADSDALVIDLHRNAIIFRCEGAKKSACSGDGRWLALDHRLYDLSNKESPRTTTFGRPVEEGRQDQRELAFTTDSKYLVTWERNETALVWDMAILSARLQPLPREPQTLEHWWSVLSEEDAAKAGDVIDWLVMHPTQAIRHIERQLRPVRAVPEATLQKWVADLDSAEFTVRTVAEEKLTSAVEQAELFLRSTLEKSESLEHRLRIQRLLRLIDNGDPTPEERRMLRAIEVLERIGNKDAQRVLQKLADGAPRAKQTIEAQAALKRLRLAKEGLRRD